MCADYMASPVTVRYIPPALYTRAVLSEDEPNIRKIDARSVPVLAIWPQLLPIIQVGCAYYPTTRARTEAIDRMILHVVSDSTMEADAVLSFDHARMSLLGDLYRPRAAPETRVFRSVRVIRLSNPTGAGMAMVLQEEDLQAFLNDPVKSHRGRRDPSIFTSLMHQLHALIWGLRAIDEQKLNRQMEGAITQIQNATGFWLAPASSIGEGRMIHPLTATLATVWMCTVYRNALGGDPWTMLGRAGVVIDEAQLSFVQFLVNAMIENSPRGGEPDFPPVVEAMIDRFRSW